MRSMRFVSGQLLRGCGVPGGEVGPGGGEGPEQQRGVVVDEPVGQLALVSVPGTRDAGEGDDLGGQAAQLARVLLRPALERAVGGTPPACCLHAPVSRDLSPVFDGASRRKRRSAAWREATPRTDARRCQLTPRSRAASISSPDRWPSCRGLEP